jgi:hypothetical protein
VGESVRDNRPVCLALQAIVTYCAGRVQRRLDIALLDNVLGSVGVIGLDPGETVCLQLDPHRNRVRPALVAAGTFGVSLLQNAELVLQMMADLMGNHIGFGKLARRFELSFISWKKDKSRYAFWSSGQ